jgi:hypothetical protein
MSNAADDDKPHVYDECFELPPTISSTQLSAYIRDLKHEISALETTTAEARQAAKRATPATQGIYFVTASTSESRSVLEAGGA